MNQIVPLAAYASTALIAAAGEKAQIRFVEFFTANIRNRGEPRGMPLPCAFWLPPDCIDRRVFCNGSCL